LADRVPATVQDLFQMVSIFDDIPAAEEHSELSSPRIQIRWVTQLNEVRNNNLSSPITSGMFTRGWRRWSHVSSCSCLSKNI